MSFRPCAVIPVFNHHACLEQTVSALPAHDLPCILVDDGSDAATKRVLERIAAAGTQVECLTLPENRGKGAAVMTGIARAGDRGFTHVLQIDADGQHDVTDIPVLLTLAQRHPQNLISGAPIYDGSVPLVRFYGRYLTHVLIWLDTLSLQLCDSMCGFRVYPIAPCLQLARHVRLGRRMDFDTDIMTRLYWAGTESRFLPTRVRYPHGGSSHYRMLADNARMISLHVRLFLGMLPRIPKLLRRNATRERHWARIRERGSLAGLRSIGFVDRVLGRRASLAIVYPVTAYFFLTHPCARRASRRFLAAVGAPVSLCARFRHFMQFSISILDKVAAWRDPERVPVQWADRNGLPEVVTSGRGVLLLSAHLGNIELARAAAARIPGLRINALVYSSNAKKVKAMLEHTSGDSRLNLIEVQGLGPETALMLREKIAAGEMVVIVGDRTPVARDSPVTHADFLGEPAPFPLGPYVLAHVLECPVYLMFCVRQGVGYKLYMEPFAERIRLPRRERDTAATHWASQYAGRLAHYARRFPLQWYNFYDFWADEHHPSNRPAQRGTAHGSAVDGPT